MKDLSTPPPDRTRKLGLAAAVALAVVIVAALGLLMLLKPAPSPANGQDTPIAEEIGETAFVGSEGGRGGQLEVTAEDDPSKVEAVIRYDEFVPAGGSRYSMTRPSAWLYLDDGRRVFIRGQRGQMVLGGADRTRPDSGNLTGEVEAFVFPAGLEPDVADPDVSLADIVAETPSLAFDLASGEISTNQKLTVRSDTIDFEGVGVVALFGEVRERLERLTVRSDGRITYRTTSSDETPRSAPAQRQAAATEQTPAGDPATPSSPTAAAATPNEPAPIAEPIETRYLAVFSDDVEITQQGRTATADLLEVWLRLLDNQLPQRTQLSHAAPAPTSLPGALGALAHAVTEATTVVENENKPVVLTWSGTLEVRPLADAPEPAPQQLAEDDLFVRLTAPRSGRVEVRDPAEDIVVRSPTLAYGLTTDRAVVTGPGPSAVTIDAEGRGRLSAGRIEATVQSGVVAVPGPGVLEGVRTGTRGGQVAWNERADFVFEIAEGRTRPVLQQALFTGDVEASDGPDGRLSSLTAGFLRTDFDRNPASPERPILTRLVARDGITADDGRGGRLKATDLLDVAFDPPAEGQNESSPRNLTAAGSVFVSRDGEWIRADRLDAALGEDGDGRLAVVDLEAEGTVELNARDDVVAFADTIRARPLDQVATLLGPTARVARGPTSIASRAIELDGLARVVRTDAGGTFAHHPPTGTSVDATWTTAMVYDDRTGLLEADGQVVAAAENFSSAGSRATDALEAERVLVRLEPNDDAPSISDEENNETTSGDAERRVLSIYASAAASEGSAPVKVESRRYAPNRPGVLARLTYLEAREVFADELAGALRVPGPGRLIVADRLDPDRAEDGAENQRRGDTLFTWAGGMDLARDAGEAEMRRSVEVVHRRLSDGEVTLLECERLTAGVGEEDAEPGRPGALGRLRSALAEGAVWLKSGEGSASREMIADRLYYDAATGEAKAEAFEGGWVTLIDGRRPTPVTARRIDWNLDTDRIELDEPGPVVSPR